MAQVVGEKPNLTMYKKSRREKKSLKKIKGPVSIGASTSIIRKMDMENSSGKAEMFIKEITKTTYATVTAR